MVTFDSTTQLLSVWYRSQVTFAPTKQSQKELSSGNDQLKVTTDYSESMKRKLLLYEHRLFTELRENLALYCLSLKYMVFFSEKRLSIYDVLQYWHILEGTHSTWGIAPWYLYFNSLHLHFQCDWGINGDSFGKTMLVDDWNDDWRT